MKRKAPALFCFVCDKRVPWRWPLHSLMLQDRDGTCSTFGHAHSGCLKPWFKKIKYGHVVASARRYQVSP